ADAIHAGFADHFVPAGAWEGLKAELCASGEPAAVEAAASEPGESALAARQRLVDRHLGGETLGDILRSLRIPTPDDPENTAFCQETLKVMVRNSPLSMACTVEIIHRLRGPGATIERALDLEYRFTARSMERGDFLEGIRAAIIDKDRKPRWRHRLDTLKDYEVAQMLMPLPREEKETTT
ncbi:MAG: enoyl-CoA hydratase/isomerase family protein, partial [Alphaproteobacteria bacterium]